MHPAAAQHTRVRRRDESPLELELEEAGADMTTEESNGVRDWRAFESELIMRLHENKTRRRGVSRSAIDRIALASASVSTRAELHLQRYFLTSKTRSAGIRADGGRNRATISAWSATGDSSVSRVHFG